MRQDDVEDPLLGSGLTPEDGEDGLGGITVTDDLFIDGTGSA